VLSGGCLGGVLLHDLGLPFLTPTINLYFAAVADFVRFVNNIELYKTCGILTEIKKTAVNFPCGKLSSPAGDVTICFMHYKTFEDAAAKWQRRMARLNLEKILVIDSLVNPAENDIALYKTISFPKLIIVPKQFADNVDFVTTDNYDDFMRNYHSGKILEFPHFYSLKKWYQHAPIVPFINKTLADYDKQATP
jgi:uncharacterized protein (DUF1919 family)